MFSHYDDMEVDEKCKNGVVWGVRGHPMSSETSPFDRAHMISYLTLIETIRVSCTVFVCTVTERPIFRKFGTMMRLGPQIPSANKN